MAVLSWTPLMEEEEEEEEEEEGLSLCEVLSTIHV